MATLSRPSGVTCRITPKRGEVFSRPELFSLVGVDFKIIELLSGDFLLVEKTGIDYNSFASKLAHQSIKGTVILCEPGEID